MPFRKVPQDQAGDVHQGPCRCEEHDPPKGYCYVPGDYEWECPRCHQIRQFTILRVEC